MFRFNTTTTMPPINRTGLGDWIKQHPLLSYGLLTFGLTWPIMLLEVLGSWEILPFRLTLAGAGLLLTLPLAYGPTLAALLVTGVTDGRAGLRALLGRLLIWRVGWRWYGAALVLPGLLGVGAWALHLLRVGATDAPLTVSWEKLWLLPLALVVRGVVNGEEIGWRGFALPHLQRRWNAVSASVILGGLWALFHLPIFFVQGTSVLGSQTDMNPLAFLIDVAAGSILITWLFNNTHGSLLIAYLYHAAVNTWTTEIFPTNVIDSAVLTTAAALTMITRFGPTRLSRSPVDSAPFTDAQ